MELSDDLLHKILNLLSPLQVFIDVVETSPKDPKLQNLHQTCKENLLLLKELLNKIDTSV